MIGKPIDLGRIPVCSRQAFAFNLGMSGSVADAASMTGMVVVGQIRKTAAVAAALVVPTIVVGAPVVTSELTTVTVEVSISESQMAALPCASADFSTPTSYVIDIEAAYSDSPTVEEIRFVGRIDVYQGGLAPGV